MVTTRHGAASAAKRDPTRPYATGRNATRPNVTHSNLGSLHSSGGAPHPNHTHGVICHSSRATNAGSSDSAMTADSITAGTKGVDGVVLVTMANGTRFEASRDILLRMKGKHGIAEVEAWDLWRLEHDPLFVANAGRYFERPLALLCPCWSSLPLPLLLS